MKTILSYTNKNAKNFLLKEESYFNFDLPKYFIFKNVLQKVSKQLNKRSLKEFYGSYKILEKQKVAYPYDFESVNYKFLNNKDGKYAWRPFQLIHPALYVSLVNEITEKDNWKFIVKRFKEFCSSSIISCLSIPIESKNSLKDKATSVSQWWQKIEQQSIELALQYEYIIHTDISDCYGSIYTHSIAWALHTKEIRKKQKHDPKLIGNIIDSHIRSMSFGQTNGIPQGSVLMDFIAEMVLGYADLELSIKINKAGLNDFKILRYRDDYRIFTNNPQNESSL